MKNQGRSKNTFICVLIFLVLTGCLHYKVEEVDYNSPQKPAAILIGDPQIYSRASLINDRRQETEYLQQLLRNSAVDSSGNSFVKFNPQIIRDLKTVEVLSANLGLNFGKVTSDTSSISDLKQQIDVAKLKAQLAVLQKQVEGINNAAPPQVTIPSPDLTTSSASASQSNTGTNVAWPDVSTLQKAISDIQTQLKEMSSFNQGPTAPSNNYSALADPRDDFTDRQAYRRDIRAALAESQLDDVHDRGGNALYRLQFQATVLPPSGNAKQWGAVKMEIKAPKLTGKDIRSHYLNWLSYISTMLSEKSLNHNNNYDRYIDKIGRLGYFNVVDIFSNANGDYYCVNHGTASDDRLYWIRKDGGVWGKNRVDDVCNYDSVANPCTWFSIKWTYAAPISLFPIDAEESLCVNYPPSIEDAVTFLKRKVGEEVAMADDLIMRNNPNNPGGVMLTALMAKKHININLPEIKFFCKEIVSKKDKDKCDNINDISNLDFTAAGGRTDRDDQSDYAVRSYSVLPRELVQRLGVTTESSQSLQTALSVAAQLSATAKGSLDVGYLSQSDARAEALSRQPLVVGFAGSEPHGKATNSYFGWLFGPQFVVKDSRTLRLQQTVRNYGVNSDISVPGWWQSLDIKISSAWVDNWSAAKLLHHSNGADGPSVVTKRISLPMTDAAYESLTNFIAAKDIGEQNSRLFAQYVVPDVVPACTSSVTFQIGGANIWRADSIFLGGVKAKNISVLPDMNGVAAEFDMASVFGTLVNTDSTVQKIPLMVSAEQGSASPLPVFVVGKRQSNNGVTICQSPLFLPTKLDSLPPTVISFSPAEICTDTKSFPLIFQGLNFPEKNKGVDLRSEYFTNSGDVTVGGDNTQLVVNLVRDNRKIADNILLTQKTIPIVLTTYPKDPYHFGDRIIIKADIIIKACKDSKTQIASLITSSVKKDKNQTITLKVALPQNYADLVISVRPNTVSNDYVWTDSDSIKNVKSGESAEVTTVMDLSKIRADKGGKLDVKVKIRPIPDKDWIEINADKPLLIEAS